MRHKVTCATCGKTERIVVEKDKKIESEWKYYGKMNINSCQTDKYFYRFVGGDFGDNKNWVKEKNKCFDPVVKPKYLEYWECPKHGGD